MIHSCRTRTDFDRLRREGVRRTGGRLWLRRVEDHACQPPRVAFAFARNAGTAPARNRLRRQLRALLGDETMSVSPGLYLFGCTTTIGSATFGELRSEVVELLS